MSTTIRELLRTDLSTMSNVFVEEEAVRLMSWHVNDVLEELHRRGWDLADADEVGNASVYEKTVDGLRARVSVDSFRGGWDPVIRPHVAERRRP